MDNNLYQVGYGFLMGGLTRMVGLALLTSAATALGDTVDTDETWLQQSALSAQQLNEASGRQGVSLQWQMNNSNQNANVSDNVLSEIGRAHV